jgi:hypothetical protein
MPAEVRQQTPREILKAIGAKQIMAPAKLHIHHLVGEADLSCRDDRRLIAVIYVGGGQEHVKAITMDYVLRSIKQGPNPASYYELTETQVDAWIVKLAEQDEWFNSAQS